MLNFLLMSLLAVTVFGVPVTGSFLTLAGRPDLLLHRHRHGLLASASRAARSRPCSCHDRHHDSGHAVRRLTDPVSSLEGGGAHRRDLPGHAHDHHQPRRVQQGAGWPIWRAFWPMLSRCRSSGIAIVLAEEAGA
jgi:ribosome-dependent ATPase